MDVGFYLGELLMRQGKVKVPGLGYFSQLRMSAYYDGNEALFYPPYNKVHFEPQPDIDDDELADYLVARKGISIASAKYFIEKYIFNLRQQAIVADVPLGNMGVFYTERAELSFKPNDRLIDDSELYGYAPVKINLVDAIPAYREHVAVSEEFIYPRQRPEPEERAIIEEDNIEPIAADEIDDADSANFDEAFIDLPEEEEEERRRPLRVLIIALLIAVILACGIFVLYTYQPATFNKLQFWKKDRAAAPVVTKPSSIVIPALDSAYTDSVNATLNDSARTMVTDTVPKARFELITGKGFKNLWAANEAVKKYRAAGLLDAKLAEDTPGRLFKVSLGRFNSVSESEAMRQKLIKENKLTKGAYTLEIANE